MERYGDAAGDRHIHQRDCQRLAAGQLFYPGEDYCRHNVRRLVSHEQWRILGHALLFRHSPKPNERISFCNGRWSQWRVRLWLGQQLPHQRLTDGRQLRVDVVFDDTSQSPQANNDSGFVTTENTALSIPSSALLANDTDPKGLTLSIAGVSNPSNGTVTYNPTTQTVSFVPTTGYTGPASFTYTVTDGQASASGNVSLTVNYPVTAQSLFNTEDTPATVTANDPNSVELGVEFQASTTGTITGIRFYKGPQNTGPHIGNLWSATGTFLASATFTNETASGWQEVDLSKPVAVTAGTTYVVSYHTNGDYSVDTQLLCHCS